MARRVFAPGSGVCGRERMMLPGWNALSNALALPAPDNSHLDSILQFTKGFCSSHPTDCSQHFPDKGQVAQEAVTCHVSPSYSQPCLAVTPALILEFTPLFEPLGNG